MSPETTQRMFRVLLARKLSSCESQIMVQVKADCSGVAEHLAESSLPGWKAYYTEAF